MRDRWGRGALQLIALVCLLCSSERGLAEVFARHQGTAVPAGFEALYAPQRTLVDLVYGGRQLGSVLAEFTPESITFLQPENVAELVPGLKDPGALVAYLAQPLDTHAAKVCVRPGQPLCGRLAPDYAGVIFDESRFRVSLFVHPDLLSLAPYNGRRYLPAADQQVMTSTHNLSVLGSGGNRQDDRYSLFGRSRVSYDHHFAFVDWVSTDQQALTLDQLGYRQDFPDHQLSVGLFDTQTDQLRALPRDPLLGLAFGRSLQRRADRSALLASPLQVFLPVRGRVDIFRDGRLVSSAFYEAGNQQIDSERLPPGSYDVQIVITGEDGTVTEQNQLFVKSSLLAPPNHPLWFVEAGQVRRRSTEQLFPEDRDATLLKTGYRWRERSWLGLGAAAAVSEDAALLELSANTFTDYLEAGAELFNSTAGGSGWSGRTVARYQQTSASLSMLKVASDEGDDGDFLLLPREQQLLSLQLNQSLSRRDQLTLSASERRSEAVRSRNYGLRYSHIRALAGGHSLNFSGEVGREEGDRRVMLSVQWRHHGPHWRHSVGAQWTESQRPGTEGATAIVSSRWYDGERFVDDLELGIQAQLGEQRRSATIDGLHRSQYGRGRAAASAFQGNADGGLQNRYQYLAGFDTSLLTGEGGVAMGGHRQGEGGIIVDLREVPDAQFAVQVDGREEFVARGGRRAALVLPAYQQYSVSVKDRGLKLVDVEADSKEPVLYPGNVATLSWQMASVNVLLGRVVREEQHCSALTGECFPIRVPLSRVRLEGAKGVVLTDENGFFQAEVDSRTEALVAYQQGRQCRLSLTGLPVQQGVIRAQALVCDFAEDAEPEEATASQP